MNDYLIGAGALLTAGPAASIAGATLHAQTDPHLAEAVRAAMVDFEGTHPAELSRILILASGWRRDRFDAEVSARLFERRDCGLADVLSILAEATGAEEVHLFARWLPGADLATELRKRDVGLVAHPLGAIERAALVSGGRFARWRAPLRVA